VNRRPALLIALLLASACGAHSAPATSPAAARPAAPSKAVRQLQTDLGQIFGTAMASRGVWGVDVRSLDKGDVLYGHDAAKLMMPASNMKILTLAAAAETLGWDYRYTTTLETTGAIDSGVLHGDLMVRGTGDPTINTRGSRAKQVIEEWVAALTTAGIHQIDGRVIGNDQAFDDEGLGAGWAWDDLQYSYAAPVGALQYDENTAALTVLPGTAEGQPASVTIEPGSGFQLLNRATTAATGTPVSIEFKRHLEQPILEVTGRVPLGSAPVVRSVAVVNPTLFFAQSLKDTLVARGIAVSGPAADFDDVAAEIAATGGLVVPRVLVSTQSPPLSDLATVMMKVSQNLYAETLLKTVGAARGGLGTVAAGETVLKGLLKGWGVADDAYVAIDGSGLSRYNYVTAETMVAVLERMYRDPRHRDAFTATLPIAGRDGTISTRLRKTRAEGNAVAKTGSIANVRALSGFVQTRDGEMLVFSILANDFVIPSATITWITDVAVETLANFSRN